MIKIHHKYWLLIFFVFLFFKASAQDSISPFNVKGTIHFGSIIPHRPIVNEVIEGHSYGYELSFYKSTIGEKDWEQFYNNPKIGVSLLAIELGNKEELGMGYGVFPFIEFPLNKRNVNWKLTLGYGLGYIEKPFNRATNFKNVVIGSHFNALIYANVMGSIQLGNSISSSAGLSLIHYSNGAYARPNLGINVLSLNTGISYHIGERKKFVAREVENRPHVWTKKMMVAFSVKEIPPVDGPKYFVSSYSFNLIKTRGNKSSYGFGTDLFYNTSLVDLILAETGKKKNSLDKFRLGLVGIYSFDVGRVSILLEMGGYVFTNYKKQGVIYNRLQTRFNVTDKVFLNLGIKTHFAVADFIEFGIGFNL